MCQHSEFGQGPITPVSRLFFSSPCQTNDPWVSGLARARLGIFLFSSWIKASTSSWLSGKKTPGDQ